MKHHHDSCEQHPLPLDASLCSKMMIDNQESEQGGDDTQIEMSITIDELFQQYSIDEITDLLTRYEAEEAAAMAEIKR